MAEKCKYCEGELSVMDSVYIESEIRTAPKKVQNLRVCFTVSANSIANKEKKEIFFQYIIDISLGRPIIKFFDFSIEIICSMESCYEFSSR